MKEIAKEVLKLNVKKQIMEAKIKDQYKELYDICMKRMQEKMQRAYIKKCKEYNEKRN